MGQNVNISIGLDFEVVVGLVIGRPQHVRVSVELDQALGTGVQHQQIAVGEELSASEVGGRGFPVGKDLLNVFLPPMEYVACCIHQECFVGVAGDHDVQARRRAFCVMHGNADQTVQRGLGSTDVAKGLQPLDFSLKLF